MEAQINKFEEFTDLSSTQRIVMEQDDEIMVLQKDDNRKISDKELHIKLIDHSQTNS